MFKVLVSDPLAAEGLAVFAAESDFEVDNRPKIPADELKEIIKDYDALLIRSGTKVTEEIVQAADRLKVVGRAGVGVDNVDIPAASRKGIIVMNTPGGNTVSTAEHSIAMMMSLARNIPQANEAMSAGKWDRKKYSGTELKGKTLGVIGMGRIGTEVIKRANGLEMKVLAFDPFTSPERAHQIGAELTDLDKIYQEADFITVHTPLNDQTRNLLNAETFAKMKDGVRIINCARGGIVNLDDLAGAIDDGKVAGAALDVYETEPPPPDMALRKYPQVILTPHLGASTSEAQINVAVDVAKQVVELLKNGTIINAVNVSSIDQETLVELGPYMSLAEKIGRFQATMMTGNIEEVDVEYSGKVTEFNTEPITVSVVKGLLYHSSEEAVNDINAPFIAKQRGIVVNQTSTNVTSNYSNLITVSIKSSEGVHKVAGTLFSADNPRIVMVNDFIMDVAPSECMLVFLNEDRPGLIGEIGTVLGERGINILRMSYGLGANKQAISIYNVDGDISADVLKELAAIPSIEEVKRVCL